MLNFLGFLFSLLKGIYKTCAIYTQVNKQASVARILYTSKQTTSLARILFAGFFGIFSTSRNKIFLDAQIKECNTKLSTTPSRTHITNHEKIRIQHPQHHNYKT